MNHQETAKLLAGMQTVWKDTAADDPDLQVVMYQAALEDVSYEDARAALKICLKELTFFPKPVEILNRLPAVRSLHRLSSPDADLQYILQTIIGSAVGLGLYDASTGRIRKPETFPNPIMAEAVRLFGWGRILDADREWLPREWEKVWNTARDTVTRQFLAGELALESPVALDAGAQPIVMAEVKALTARKAMGS